MLVVVADTCKVLRSMNKRRRTDVCGSDVRRAAVDRPEIIDLVIRETPAVD